MTSDDWYREACIQKKKNLALTNQLEEANELMNYILDALERGPCNDWAKHAIERYQKKYSE